MYDKYEVKGLNYIMQTEFWEPIKLSMQIVAVSGVVTFILGVLAAHFMAKRKFKGSLLIETIFLLPLVLPPTVIGFLLIIIFGKNSPIGSLITSIFDQPIMFTWWAAAIASLVVSFPLMYQSAKAGFMTIDGDIEDAARVEGASEWRVFLTITMPLAVRSLITGSILSVARGLGEFGATLMFAGNIPGRTQTIPTAIYVAIDSGNMQLAWMWVLSIIIISFVMMITVNLIKQ